ncbi:MAG: hypothetical protein KDE04_26775, partial [Anaerolineales bacterium]|nr:hypothetical protein [Anaerolineales bacterium]
ALTLAESEGYIRLFIGEGPPLVRALKALAAGAEPIPAHIHRLLLAARGQAGAPPKQPLVEPLSERELEILGLLAQGLTNRQISDQLYLALSTVKGHNRNIFSKLQAERRTEAIARARDLGLLPD